MRVRVAHCGLNGSVRRRKIELPDGSTLGNLFAVLHRTKIECGRGILVLNGETIIAERSENAANPLPSGGGHVLVIAETE